MGQREAVVLDRGSGKNVWCVGSYSSVKVEGSQTGGAYATVEDLTPQESGAPMHRHLSDDEAFHVLEGAITFYVEGHDPIKAGPGWFIHIPGGMVHGFRVDSETSRHLIITTPHHVDFYLSMSDPALRPELPPAEEPDYERIGAACQQYGVEFMGEWPEG